MPKEGLNIYFTITDGASVTLAKIGEKTKSLDKETQQLAQSYESLRRANEPLIKKQAELERQLDSAKKATKDARKEFNKLGDAVSADAYDKAKLHQEEIRKELLQTTDALKENEAAFKQNMETVRKGSVGGLSGANSGTGLLIGLISGQVGDMLSSSLGGAAEAFATSALGIPAASMLSGIVSDAISGAAAGAAFGPLGALIGGVGGALSGALSGQTEIQKVVDDAFKEYYAQLYEDVNANTEEMISGGSTIAGGREQTRMAFVKRFGGDAAAADAYLDQVQKMAGSTNYSYDEITGYSKQLLNTYAPEKVFGVLQSLSDVTAGLSLSSSDINVMISGLARMRTTGKATSEYLNYFSERGVDVYEALASVLGVDKSKVAGMVTKGDVTGDVAAQAILDYIDSTYGGLSENLMTTYDAMAANLEDVMSNLEAAGGEGYNEMRKAGLDADIEAYGGALGEAVAEINRISGENKAYLENLSGQYQREALSALLLGEDTSVFSDEDQAKLAAMREDYLAAEAAYRAGDQEAGLTMEALREDAEAMATAAYESSQQYQALMDTQLDQIAAIRENTAGLEATKNAYLQSQELSKGIAATVGYVSPFALTLAGRTQEQMETQTRLYKEAMASGDASAYTDYVIRQAGGFRWRDAFSQLFGKTSNSKQEIQVNITGNNFTGTPDEMADQLVERIAGGLRVAAVSFDG